MLEVVDTSLKRKIGLQCKAKMKSMSCYSKKEDFLEDKNIYSS